MLALARVAVLRLVRDRTNAFFVVVFPLLLVLLLGVQFGGPATGSSTVAIVGAPPVDVAGTVAEGLQALEVGTLTVADGVVAERAVERGEADAALLLSTTDGVLAATWLTRPGDPLPALRVQVAGMLADATAQQRSVAVAAALGGDGALPAVQAAPITRTEVGGDAADVFAGLGRFDLGASQQLLLFVFITALTSSAGIVQARRWGVIDRVLVGPTPPRQVVLGLGLGQLAIALVQALVVVVGSAVVFDVGWGDPVATAAVVLVFAAVAAAAGLLLGAVLRNEEQTGGVAVPAALVLAALGGSMMPLDFFGATMRRVATFTPHAWANIAFAEIVREGGTVADVLPSLAVLAAMAVGLGAAAAVVLRRRMGRAR